MSIQQVLCTLSQKILVYDVRIAIEQSGYTHFSFMCQREMGAIPFAFQLFKVVASCHRFCRFCRLRTIAENCTGSGRTQAQLKNLIQSLLVGRTQQTVFTKQYHDVGEHGMPEFVAETTIVNTDYHPIRCTARSLRQSQSLIWEVSRAR